MRDANFFYAQLFMYLFIFFVVSLVQNIFMVIVEDSYIQIKYAKNFEWLNPHDNAGGEGGAGGGNAYGGGGAPPPPNQMAYSNDPPEAVKKHLLQLGISPENFNQRLSGDVNNGALADSARKNSEMESS